MSEEELVPIELGDNYYLGAQFYSGVTGDYFVPRSTLERWEAALDAYDDMQDEIEKVMREQFERVSALRAERRGPKSPMQTFIEQVYAKQMTFALNVPPLLRGPEYKDPE